MKVHRACFSAFHDVSRHRSHLIFRFTNHRGIGGVRASHKHFVNDIFYRLFTGSIVVKGVDIALLYKWTRYGRMYVQ